MSDRSYTLRENINLEVIIFFILLGLLVFCLFNCAKKCCKSYRSGPPPWKPVLGWTPGYGENFAAPINFEVTVPNISRRVEPMNLNQQIHSEDSQRGRWEQFEIEIPTYEIAIKLPTPTPEVQTTSSCADAVEMPPSYQDYLNAIITNRGFNIDQSNLIEIDNFSISVQNPVTTNSTR